MWSYRTSRVRSLGLQQYLRRLHSALRCTSRMLRRFLMEQGWEEQSQDDTWGSVTGSCSSRMVTEVLSLGDCIQLKSHLFEVRSWAEAAETDLVC